MPVPFGRLFRPEERLSREEAFEILYNSRRRATLEFLHRHGRPCSMDELIDHIAATENEVPIGELTDQQRRRVYVSLYQTHLPLLDEADAIEYDQSTQAIEPGPCLDELLPYFDTPTEREIPWRAYYGRLFFAYAVVVAAVAVGLVPASSGLLLALAGLVLFLVVASLHGLDGTG